MRAQKRAISSECAAYSLKKSPSMETVSSASDAFSASHSSRSSAVSGSAWLALMRIGGDFGYGSLARSALLETSIGMNGSRSR